MLVYRGLEFETLAGFTTRIRSEFPSAEILYKNTPPDQTIVQGIGQRIFFFIYVGLWSSLYRKGNYQCDKDKILSSYQLSFGIPK